MKKSYFWGLLLAIMALIPAQNAFADYCKYSGTVTDPDRKLNALTITDGVNSVSVTSIQTGTRKGNFITGYYYVYNIYSDKTSSVLETYPGAELRFSNISWEGSWMQGYVFIDYNKDESFNNTANNNGTTGGELVSYNCYNVSDNYGTDILGNSVYAENAPSASNMPSWKLPADLAAGDYRLRFNIAWNSIDPCGYSEMASHRGTMVDITLRVTLPSRTITVTSNDSDWGTVSGGGTASGSITITATPNEGYMFKNWTLNGVEVSTSATFVDETAGDKEYVANFEVDPALDRSGWEATASSYENDGEGAAGGWPKHTIDGQTSTFWHSDYSVSPHPTAPHWLQYNLGSVQKFTSFNYVSRDEKSTNIGCNGNAKTYKLYVSNSDISANLGAGYVPNGLTAISEGEFVYDGVSAEHVVDLGAEYQGQYVFLLITDSWNSSSVAKYGNCAEFYLYYEPTAPMQERTITVVSEDENKGTVSGGGTGSEPIVISATANSGYRFLNWTVEGSVVSETANYTDKTEGDKTYTANFVKVYNVTTTVTNGTVQVSGQNSEGTFDEGSNVTIEAVAANGYVFKNWVIDGGASGDTNPMTFAVTEDYEIEAIFEKTYFTDFGTSTRTYGDRYLTSIAFSDGVSTNETITVNQPSTNGAQIYFDKTENAITLLSGTEVTPTIEWAGYKMHGYLFVDWNNDKTFGNDLGANGVPNDGSELIAYTYYQGFDHTGASLDTESDPAPQKMKPFTISSSIDPGEYRARFTIMWDNVNANATSDKANGMAVVDFTLRVTQPVPPTVYAVSAEANPVEAGNVTISATEVEENKTVDLTATANEGYEFVNWTVEGTEVSTDASFTATVTAETAYVANFVAKEFKVTYKVDGEEYTTEKYKFGETITPIAEPTKAGYTFSGWSEIPATMPAEDVTVTGTFTEIIKENIVVADENREENANAAYANVTVANEKVWDIKANTISADKVSVFVSATGAAPQIKIENGGQVTAVLEVNRVVKKGEWAMMALPFAVDLANVTVNGAAAQSNVNIKVMVYDAAYRATESIENWTISGWKDLVGTTIAANQGFAVAINSDYGDEQTVTFASASQTYDGTDKEVALDRHASTVNGGADADWNFFGNPTLANAEKGADYALYIYNAEDDSYDEYASSDVIACQPYAAMFVQSADDFNTLGFSNGAAGILNDANGVFGEMQFSLNGDDEARIVLSDEASEEFVRNEDALYFAAPNANLAQLYIVKGNIKMAVSEQPELSESIALGYKAAKAGEQTLTLTSLPDNASVVLKDNVTGDEVALTVGDSYTFESAAGTFNNRFLVTTTDLTGIAQATTDGDIKVIVKGDEISVYGAEAGADVTVYATNGMAVANTVANEGVTTLVTSATGVLVVKVAGATFKVIK